MVNFKIKATVDIKSLTKTIEKKQNLIRKNIITALRTQAIPHLIDRVMLGYDNLSERADLLPEDPTNPSNWRVEFLAKLHEDLERNFMITGNKITIMLGDKKFLGYDASGGIEANDTEPLHWLVFFLEGLVGDWGFISPETYIKLTGRKYQPEWGRFADGFMINKEDYNSNGWGSTIPFEEIRHPFSGFSPLDIFKEAADEFHLRPFIQKAIDAAIQGKQL